MIKKIVRRYKQNRCRHEFQLIREEPRWGDDCGLKDAKITGTIRTYVCKKCGYVYYKLT